MSRLIWDAVGEKFYEMGTKLGVLYPMNNTGTYDKGVAWNGLIAVTESPSGAEETKLYADDIKYASLRSAEEYGYTIEAYTYPPRVGALRRFRTGCNGCFHRPAEAPGLWLQLGDYRGQRR